MNGMPNDEAYLLVLRADLKAKAQEGDILGATEAFGKAIEVSSRIAEEAQKEDLKYLAHKLPAPQWTTVLKATTFGWLFAVHYGNGKVELAMGKKIMTVEEDGSYTRN